MLGHALVLSRIGNSKHPMQQACLPLVEVREGPGLVRDKGQVKRLAVVRDDAVGVVQPPAHLLMDGIEV